MTVKEQLKTKYGVTIMDDSYIHPLSGKTIKLYRMYSADGCPWEKGLTLRQVQKECRNNADALIRIKNRISTHK